MVHVLHSCIGRDSSPQNAGEADSLRFAAPSRDRAVYRELPPDDSLKTIRFGRLEMMEDQYSVKTQTGSISLTAAEYRVLWKLARNLGSVVGYADLDRPDASERRVNNRAVQAIVASLRRKLGTHGCEIRTTRDLGYRLSR
jgi:DNA-binding response OmpR family regulator